MNWKLFGGIVLIVLIAGCGGAEAPPINKTKGENLVRFANHFEIYETDQGHQLQIKYDGLEYIIDVDSARTGRPKLNSQPILVIVRTGGNTFSRLIFN